MGSFRQVDQLDCLNMSVPRGTREAVTNAGYERQLTAWIHRACLLEATAPKPGNVHPGAAFADLRYVDFVASAEVAAPALAAAARVGVGAAVLAAIQATRGRVGTNTNLGIVLLIAPLAAVPQGIPLADGINAVLAGLTMRDAELVFEAIRTAQPGGLGQVAEGDVSTAPTMDLLCAMGMAADRDSVARQYVTDFEIPLSVGIPIMRHLVNRSPGRTLDGVVNLHLHFMARWPDSLIARKCGLEVAHEAQHRADRVLEWQWPESPRGIAEIQEFDTWLRADGHRRNPGTTADLVAATLFAYLREGGVFSDP
ncbi:MAG: triphosphoribosyl-dephospho-CoA synthetase [Planctomycetota bacterium]|nr:MAG: triphosphoribosyl-dephospho-CoA synthetase [Planctomycetota bacterium]